MIFNVLMNYPPLANLYIMRIAQLSIREYHINVGKLQEACRNYAVGKAVEAHLFGIYNCFKSVSVAITVPLQIIEARDFAVSLKRWSAHLSKHS